MGHELLTDAASVCFHLLAPLDQPCAYKPLEMHQGCTWDTTRPAHSMHLQSVCCHAKAGTHMEEASVEQLLQVGHNSQVDQLSHIPLFALTQLLAFQPAGGQHSPGGVLLKCGGDDHLRCRQCQNITVLDRDEVPTDASGRDLIKSS